MNTRWKSEKGRRTSGLLDLALIIGIGLLVTAVWIRLFADAGLLFNEQPCPSFSTVSWRPPLVLAPASMPRIPQPGEPGGNPHPMNPNNLRDYFKPFNVGPGNNESPGQGFPDEWNPNSFLIGNVDGFNISSSGCPDFRTCP